MDDIGSNSLNPVHRDKEGKKEKEKELKTQP